MPKQLNDYYYIYGEFEIIKWMLQHNLTLLRENTIFSPTKYGSLNSHTYEHTKLICLANLITNANFFFSFIHKL